MCFNPFSFSISWYLNILLVNYCLYSSYWINKCKKYFQVDSSYLKRLSNDLIEKMLVEIKILTSFAPLLSVVFELILGINSNYEEESRIWRWNCFLECGWSFSWFVFKLFGRFEHFLFRIAVFSTSFLCHWWRLWIPWMGNLFFWSLHSSVEELSKFFLFESWYLYFSISVSFPI